MITLPQKTKIIKKTPQKSIFEIEGLYPGYGVTIGNSLRRVLLSSLEGAAITKVKIKGVSHEFSTMNGVLEDAISILLNLKKIRFKMYGSELQIGTLNIKGERQVKAADFKLPPQVEIINKDQHIATLTDKKIALEMEVQIEKGIGYEPIERRKKEKLEIGTIAVDAIYTPITNVAFRVENMRVGERTDYDKLILEVETDGTVTPEESFLKTCEILISHFSFFPEPIKEMLKREQEEVKRSQEKKKVEKKKSEKPQEETLKVKIEDLKISPRTIKALKDYKIKTVSGLIKKRKADILNFKGIGEAGLKELKKALKKLDLTFTE